MSVSKSEYALYTTWSTIKRKDTRMERVMNKWLEQWQLKEKLILMFSSPLKYRTENVMLQIFNDGNKTEYA